MRQIVVNWTKCREVFHRIVPALTDRSNVMNVQPAALTTASASSVDVRTLVLIAQGNRVPLSRRKWFTFFARAKCDFGGCLGGSHGMAGSL